MAIDRYVQPHQETRLPVNANTMGAHIEEVGPLIGRQFLTPHDLRGKIGGKVVPYAPSANAGRCMTHRAASGFGFRDLCAHFCAC